MRMLVVKEGWEGLLGGGIEIGFGREGKEEELLLRRLLVIRLAF